MTEPKPEIIWQDREKNPTLGGVIKPILEKYGFIVTDADSAMRHHAVRQASYSAAMIAIACEQPYYPSDEQDRVLGDAKLARSKAQSEARLNLMRVGMDDLEASRIAKAFKEELEIGCQQLADAYRPKERVLK